MIKLQRGLLLRIALLISAVGLAQAVLSPRPAGADTPPLCAKYPIPVYNGVSAQPSVSGDGTRVAFWSTGDFNTTDNLDGNVEVFVQLGTNGLFTRTRQVTNSRGTVLGGFNLGPAISGDGKRVAFFSDRDLVPGRNRDGSFELFIADLTGLTSDPDADIALTQVTSSTTTGINTSPAINSPAISDTFPVYYVAFASDQNYTGANADGNTEIFRAKIEGDVISITQVTSTTIDFTNDFPAISEDGSRIAYATNSNSPGSAVASVSVAKIGQNGVTVVTQTLQTFSSQTNGQIAISADGFVVAWSSDAGNPIGTSDKTQIWVARDVLSGTQELRQVTYLTTTGLLSATNSQPALNQNGSLVAFVSTVGSASSLYLAVTDAGAGAPAFVDLASDSGHPRFSYTGQNIVYGSPQSTSGLSASTVKYGDCKNTDLKVTGSMVPAGPNPGDVFTQTVLVQNVGKFSINGVGVSIQPPAGISTQPGAIGITITQGTCGAANPTSITCTLNDLLGVGQEVTLTARYKLLITTTETVVGYYTATAPLSDTNPADNAVPVIVFVSAADSQAGIAVSPDPAAAGQTAVYTFSVTALGPNRSQTGTITATLSPSVTLLSLTPGQVVSTGNSLSWNVLPLLVGNTRIYTAVVLVDPNLRAVLTGTVTVATPRDPNPDNDTASLETVTDARAALSISSYARTAVAYTGGRVTYTLLVTNAGPSAVSAVRIDNPVSDSVFDQVTSVSSLGSCGTPAVTCQIPLLPPNTMAVITVGARVFTDASVIDVNTATIVTATNPVPSGVFASASVTLVVNMIDLQAHSTTTPVLTAGAPASYTFAIFNASPAAASNVILSASVPAAITSTSVISAFSANGNAGTTCVYSPDPDNSLVCAIPSLAANSSFTATLNFTVNPGASGIFTDVFTVSATAQDNAPDNNTLTRTAALIVSAPLTVSLDVQPSLVVGRMITYTTWVTNSGPSRAQNVVLTQAVPNTLDFGFGVPQPAGGASCSSLLASVFTCTLGALDGNQGFNVLITATVDALASPAYTTTASAYSDTPPTTNAAPAQDTLVQAEVNLIVTKFADRSMAYDNDDVVFTILITNASANVASGVVVTDRVPSLLLDISGNLQANPTPDRACSNKSVTPVVTCTFRTIAPGAAARVVITGQVNTSSSVWITNTARAAGNGAESIASDNFSAAYVALNAYELQAQQDPTVVITAGAQGVWTFYRRNNSPRNAANVTLVATLPQGITVTSQSPGGCSFAAPTLTCSGVTVNAGASAPVVVTFTVGAGVSGTLQNTVTVSKAGALDPDPSNNTLVSTTLVQVNAPLTVSLALPALASPGGVMTYTARVTNTGPSLAASAILTLGLVSDPNLVYGAPVGPGCAAVSGGVLTCTLGTIQPGASITVLLPVTVTATPDSYGGTASAYSAAPPTTASQPAVVRRVISVASIAILKTANTAIATTNDLVTFTIRLTNTSPSMAVTGVLVTDTLPVGLKFITVTALSPDPAVCSSSLIVTCGLGTLQNGQAALIILTTQVTSTTPVVLTNTATASASASGTDALVSGGSATAVIQVPAVDLRAVTPAPNPSPFVAGNQYTIRYGVANTSTQPGNEVTLTAVLPLSITAGPLAPGCSYVAPTLTCGGLTVQDGTTTTVAFTFTLDSAATGTFREVFTVTSSAPMPDPVPSNNVLTRSTPISVSAPLTLSVAGSAPTTAQPFTYTVLVTNTGPSLAAGARMTQALPSGSGLAFGAPIAPLGATCTAVVAGKFSCAFGDLPALDSRAVVITATVASALPQVFTTTVTAYSLAAPTLINAPVVVDYAVAWVAPLTVSVSGSSPVTTATPFTYTVLVTNTGPALAPGARMTQTLPVVAGLTFGAPQPSGGPGCGPLVGQTFSCDLGDLPALAARSVVISAVVSSVPTATFTTTVTSASLAAPTTSGAPIVINYAR